MTELAWSVVAVGAGLVGAAAALHVLLPRPSLAVDPGPEGPPPRTALQLRAWWAFAIAVVMTLALALVLVTTGASGYAERPAVRFGVLALLFAGFLGQALVVGLTRRAIARGEVVLDERDLAILAVAPWAQVVALLLTLSAWTVGLTETYWRDGAVPVVFLTLILWSGFLVCMLALPLGVLLGSRRP